MGFLFLLEGFCVIHSKSGWGFRHGVDGVEPLQEYALKTYSNKGATGYAYALTRPSRCQTKCFFEGKGQIFREIKYQFFTTVFPLFGRYEKEKTNRRHTKLRRAFLFLFTCDE